MAGCSLSTAVPSLSQSTALKKEVRCTRSVGISPLGGLNSISVMECNHHRQTYNCHGRFLRINAQSATSLKRTLRGKEMLLKPSVGATQPLVNSKKYESLRDSPTQIFAFSPYFEYSYDA